MSPRVSGFTFTTINIVLEPPEGTVSNVQVVGRNGFPGTPALHVPLLLVTETMLTSAGSTSSTTTLTAVDGPVLTISSSYRRLLPAMTGSGPARPLALPVHSGPPGLSALHICRSATAVTEMESHAWLLTPLGSGVALTTVAQSLMSMASLAVRRTVMVVRPPAGSVPRLQVTMLPTMAQGLAAGGLKVAEAMGKAPMLRCVSVTTTLRASDGPRLSTKMGHSPVSPAWSG